MGRPKAITIDKVRLKGLREEKGLAPKDIGAAIFGKKLSAARSYRRIESEGKTSRNTAVKIAKILGVSLAVLDGTEDPTPENYLDHPVNAQKRMMELIGEYLADGGNTGLKRLYEELLEKNDSDVALQKLAHDIKYKIWVAQWSFSSDKIDELIADIGIPKEEVLRPANSYGRWYIEILGSPIQSNREIVDGVFSVIHHIRENSAVKKFLECDESDASIKIWHDEPWIRIEMTLPVWIPPQTIQINFVRCCAVDKGLRWVHAPWLDLSSLKDQLERFACENFNFVATTRHQFPSSLERLCFLITENVVRYMAKHEKNNKPYPPSMIVTGSFDDITNKEDLKNFGSSHGVYVTNGLLNNILCALHPHISKFPAECWSVHCHYQGGGIMCIKIELSRPIQIEPDVMSFSYDIALVEETSRDEFVYVPWRKKNMEIMRGYLEKYIKVPSAFIDLEEISPGKFVPDPLKKKTREAHQEDYEAQLRSLEQTPKKEREERKKRLKNRYKEIFSYYDSLSPDYALPEFQAVQRKVKLWDFVDIQVDDLDTHMRRRFALQQTVAKG